MKNSRRLLFGIILGIGMVGSSMAQGIRRPLLVDTMANRGREAARYLQIISASEIVGDVTRNIALSLPAGQRNNFTTLMKDEVDLKSVHGNISAAMVKHMTAGEIRALADFYSTPVGKSAMKKMGLCMAEVTPLVQKEIQSAMQRLQKKGLVIFKTTPPATTPPSP